MDFPNVNWRSYAGLQDVEQYKKSSERKANAAIRKRFIQSLQSGSSRPSRSPASTSVRAPKRAKKNDSARDSFSINEENEDIPDLDQDDNDDLPDDNTGSICKLCDTEVKYRDDTIFKKHLIDDHFRDELLKRHICAQRCPYCNKLLGNSDPYAKIVHVGGHQEVLDAMYELALKNKALKSQLKLNEEKTNPISDREDDESFTDEPFTIATTSTPKAKSNHPKSDLEKRMLELERENAQLKYRRDELTKENAQMSGSWKEMKSIRNLLVAKIKVCNPEEDSESLLKKNLGYLVTRYEASIVQPPTSSREGQKETEKLKEKVQILEEKKKSLKEKLRAAKSSKSDSRVSDDFKSLKEDLLTAVNDKNQGELKQVRQERDRAQIEIKHLRESLSEYKTKLQLQREIKDELYQNVQELKNVLELPLDSNFSNVIIKVKDLKDKNYEKEEAENYAAASDTINEAYG